MKYKSVSLVSLPRQDLIRPPAALPVLAGVCEHAQVDYTIWDFNLWLKKNCDQDVWESIDANWMKIDGLQNCDQHWFTVFRQLLDQYVTILLDTSPDLICISVFTNWSAHCAWEFIHAVRSKSSVEIVIGGTGITTVFPHTQSEPMCDMLLDQKLIDFYIYGEGEINFLNLLNGSTEHKGINNTNSLQIELLDSLPPPSYKKINANDYMHLGEPSLMINGSRGCVRACSYCNVAHYWPSFRYRSGASLADEIYQTWKQTGVKNFEFSDSLINGSIKQFRNLNARLIELRHQDANFDISYKGQFICRDSNSFKEKDYQDMADAGCDYLYVGVETFSESVRLSMDKKFDNRALDFHLAMTAKYGIPNVLLMIVGYPTETQHDHQLNLQGLVKYQKYSKAGIIKLITFGLTTNVLEHTPLYFQQDELGIVPEFEDFKSTTNWVSLNNPTLTFKERVKRWIELTETADQLGYRQPRIYPIVERLVQVLDITSNKKSVIPIKNTSNKNK